MTDLDFGFKCFIKFYAFLECRECVVLPFEICVAVDIFHYGNECLDAAQVLPASDSKASESAML